MVISRSHTVKLKRLYRVFKYMYNGSGGRVLYEESKTAKRVSWRGRTVAEMKCTVGIERDRSV